MRSSSSVIDVGTTISCGYVSQRANSEFTSEMRQAEFEVPTLSSAVVGDIDNRSLELLLLPLVTIVVLVLKVVVLVGEVVSKPAYRIDEDEDEDEEEEEE